MLDWNYEPNAEPVYREADEEYLIAYVQEIMKMMRPSFNLWSSNAADFLASLHLPEVSVRTPTMMKNKANSGSTPSLRSHLVTPFYGDLLNSRSRKS